MSYHYRHSKKPYVKIGKYFTFAAAHELPDHKGLCKYTHGHEWKVGIQIKKRINRKTGMVMDFSDLKQIVNDHVISVLDHSFLNETIYNPTAENLLIWIWERLMFDGLLKGIHEIELWESSDSVATINEEGMRSVLIKKEKLGELNLLFPNYSYNKLLKTE
jgi:6-pyruvoyltetrahydropterin/6-carboxytetrahydropterin synthase